MKPKQPRTEPRKPGRPIPGYSLNTQGERVDDETIKRMLLELVTGDGFPYGYKKLTIELRETYGLIINRKKVYRLCKELDILRPRRVTKPCRPIRPGRKRKAERPNQHWEIDLKYGYIHGTNQFFYQISIIDIFDRCIVGSHIGLSAKAKDAAKIVEIAAQQRNIDPGQLTLRSDNGPQFRAKEFTETLDRLGINHERIPINTPNLNAYIESFHSILEDECYSRHEFETFQDAYREVTAYLDYYNNRRRHGSLGYVPPMSYYLKNRHTKEALKAA